MTNETKNAEQVEARENKQATIGSGNNLAGNWVEMGKMGRMARGILWATAGLALVKTLEKKRWNANNDRQTRFRIAGKGLAFRGRKRQNRILNGQGPEGENT